MKPLSVSGTKLGLLASLVLLAVLAVVVIQSGQDLDLLEEKKAGKSNQQQILEAYGKLPLSFEANQGQADSHVQFLSRSGGATLFLTANEAVLRIPSPNPSRDREGAVRQRGLARTLARRLTPQDADSAPPKPDTILRMKLVGANPNPKVVGLEELPGKSNYFIGNDPKQWRTNVPNYGKVRFEGVYPGVDLVYYGNQRQLEYDFVVAPGADPAAIRLGFAGAERLEIDPQGELALQTSAGEVRWHKPVVYQEVGGVRQIVDGRYMRKGKEAVGFAVASFDPRHPLIIDPVLVYSTYLGGSGEDQGLGIAVDSSGNAYVTGVTQSTDFPTASPLQAANGGGQDVFVTKLNAAGTALVYSTYLGGSGNDIGSGIAVDSSGNAYVTGNTFSTNFPTASPFQAANGGTIDAFVTKLNNAGSTLVYSSYLGGSTVDVGLGIAVDSSGNAYVTGFASSTNFPTASPIQAASAGSPDAFVTKLNAGGSALVYSTYLGGSGIDIGDGIAVDSSGNAYVMGQTGSANFPTASPFQAASGGGTDAFVAKLNVAGSALVYSTYLGGSATEFAGGIAVDSSGNAYVTGITFSTNFPTANAFQAASGGSTDAFVTKLNAAGSALVYSTYLGRSDFEEGSGIAVDSSGNAYVTGRTGSTNFPTASPIQAASGGCDDAFVTKFNAVGSALVYSTYLGGSSCNDQTLGIAVDSSGNAYVTGSTPSTNFPTANAFQPAFGGNTDAFAAKITEVITVTIDIKPGSDPNSINPKSRGTIPVAILSSATFNAFASVDTTSLTFGHTGNENSLAFCNGSPSNINGDAFLDLMCHFDTQKTGFQSGDTVGTLKGTTVSGTPIMGTDSVRIVR